MRHEYYRARAPGSVVEHAIHSPDRLEHNHYREGRTLCGIMARSKSSGWSPLVPKPCRRCVQAWKKRQP